MLNHIYKWIWLTCLIINKQVYINLQSRQAFLLSDQAAANAAYQFNATSQNQVNQFYDNMSAQMSEQNAAR